MLAIESEQSRHGPGDKGFLQADPLRQMPYGRAMAMLFLMEAGEEA